MNIVFLFSCFISKALSLALVALTTSDVNSLINIQKDGGSSLRKWNSNNHKERWDANEISTQVEKEDNQVIQVNIPPNIVHKMEDSVMTNNVAMISILNSIKGNSCNVYFKKLHLYCLLNYFNVTVLRNLKCIELCDEWSRKKLQRHLVQKAGSKCKHGNPKLKYSYANFNSRQKRSLSNSFTSDDSKRLSHSSKGGKGSTNFRKPRRLVAKTLTDDLDAMENIVTVEETSHSRIQTKNNSVHHHTSSKFDNFKYWQMRHQLELERSKDSEWAFICMFGLMVLLAICCYCCRLSHIKREHEIHVEFDDSFHYVSLKDILMGKKRFLPMFKKKKNQEKVQRAERSQLANPDSDTSEEELMLYDTNHQTYTGPERKPRT
ncbi:hypothetical protein CHS0354_041521 [Potamilus streckersoni]|uniref:Uncharacterized protein n=1 Tax=Potamilus streckersoni TaxID=2493646 RepID=A0AAE0TB24_9BIVA|nr:hypothetical protein CHS0354_041521 [Potamilus streckersoni]